MTVPPNSSQARDIAYVLHPYKMVKDHRTNHETGNTQAVLDGRLDDFMEAYLRQRVGQST